MYLLPCGLCGCKNSAHFVSWPEVVKGVPNQGVDCFVSWGSFFCFSFVFLVYIVLCLIVFGCQYQCNWLPGKTRLRNDLLCVEWDLKPHTLAHIANIACPATWHHVLGDRGYVFWWHDYILSLRLVSTYLVHHGYCSTAESFVRTTGESFDEELVSIRNRQSKCMKCVVIITTDLPAVLVQWVLS